MLQTTDKWNREWIVNKKIPATNANSASFANMCISKAEPSGLRHVQAEYKDIMCQIPIRILEYHVTPNSSYQNLKVCVSKVQKNYLKMNVCNTVIIKL